MLSEADRPNSDAKIYEALIARVGTGDTFPVKGKWTTSTEDGISLDIVVYDSAYEPHPDLTDDYEKGFPPRIRPQLEEGSYVVRPSYAVAGRGGGSTGEGAPGTDIGVYLIRCTATTKTDRAPPNRRSPCGFRNRKQGCNLMKKFLSNINVIKRVFVMVTALAVIAFVPLGVLPQAAGEAPVLPSCNKPLPEGYAQSVQPNVAFLWTPAGR